MRMLKPAVSKIRSVTRFIFVLSAILAISIVPTAAEDKKPMDQPSQEAIEHEHNAGQADGHVHEGGQDSQHPHAPGQDEGHKHEGGQDSMSHPHAPGQDDDHAH